MTLISLFLAVGFGFSAGVLAMSLLRMASPDPSTTEPASDLRPQRRKVDLVAGGERPMPHA